MKFNTPQLQRLFLKWLQGVLQHDRSRAILREEVDQHELPVIDLGVDDRSRRTGPTAKSTKPESLERDSPARSHH